MKPLLSLVAVIFLAIGTIANAQANIAFGGARHDSRLPVEISSDSLSIDQASGKAVFIGNVVISQGALKLAAGRVEVEYQNRSPSSDIEQLRASGGVTFVNGAEAAEADQAVYTLTTGSVVMTGDVLLTQGPSALSGDRLVIDLNTGTGRVEGRVRSVLQTGGN